MRRFLLMLALPLLAVAALALAANVQIWPQLPGVPNYSIGLPEAMYGQHPMDRESYGEGWFWLGTYNDGSYSFTNFMISNLGPGDNKGTMDVTVWEPSGKTYLQRAAFTSGPMKAAVGTMDVQVNNNRVWGKYPNFNLKLAEKDIAMDLQYQAVLPSFTINSGRVVYGKVDDYYSVYVTTPRAKVTGTIKTPGGSRQVTGYGYTDHGVVTMMPYEYSNRWFTLRSFHEKYTLDILEFTVPQKFGGQTVPMIIFGENNQIVYGGTQYKLTPSNWQTEPKFGKKYPGDYDFVIDRPGKIKVEGHYAVKKVMHVIDILSQLNFVERQIAGLFAKSYVLRFFVEVKANVTYPDGRQEAFTAPGVAEVLYIQ